MDSFKSIYKSLFSVELLHDGYNFFQQNLISENIKIKPDTQTKTLFANHAIDYRFNNGTLVCLMRGRQLVPPASLPVMSFIEFDDNVRMRFLVYSTSVFLAKTQVVAAGKTQVYQFSNQANAGTNGFIAQHEAGVNNDDLQTTVAVEPEENCFAVIDIHNNATINVSYDLFGGDKRLLSPAYKIRFLPKP